MTKKLMNRREAVVRLAQLTAALTGVGGLAAGQGSPGQRAGVKTISAATLDKLANIKAVSYGAKVIKGFLIPRDDVFMGEFGRVPGSVLDTGGSGGCEFFFSAAGSGCGKQNCGGMGGCNDNNCTTQTCGRYNGECGKNSCGTQTKGAAFDAALCGVNNDIFSVQFANGIMNDPFVQGFMAELKITTSRQLAAELRRMLLGRR